MLVGEPPTARVGMDTSSAKRIRVVAVDDQPTYAFGLKTLLTALADDIEVVGVATNGAEGIDVVGDELPDLVLMDIRMPTLEGVEAARKIHQLFPGVKIIMLTVSEDPRDVHASLMAGVMGYLSKDVEPEQLIAAIRAVRGGEIVLCPFAASVSFLDAAQVAPLTDAEIHILKLMARGCEHATIAGDLAVSDSTLKRMMHDVHRKLGVSNRLEAVFVAAKRGLI